VVLQFAHWQTDEPGRVLAELSDQFNKSTPHVVVQQLLASYSTHFARMSKAFAGGNPPDVFIESGPYFVDHLKSQSLLDLSALIAADALDLGRYWTEPSTRLFDSHRYALPLWADDDLVYYNQDLFAKAGVAEPTDAWTWGDLLSAAQRLTEGKPGETSRWGMLLINELQGGWGSFVASNGGSWLDSANPMTLLSAPAAEEALRFVVDAILVRHAAVRPTEQQRLTQAGSLDPFLRGQVAILLNGAWEMPLALKQAGFRWDVAPLPRAPRTTQRTSVASVQPISAARVGRNVAEAWQFLRFLIDPEAQRAWTRGKVRLPALMDVARDQSSGYVSPPPAHANVVPLGMNGAEDLHFVANWAAWRAAVVNALEPAFDGRVPLSDAITLAVTAVDAALRSSPANQAALEAGRIAAS